MAQVCRFGMTVADSRGTRLFAEHVTIIPREAKTYSLSFLGALPAAEVSLSI
jgi:hypothetical protein